MKMTASDIEELHKIICEWAIEKDYGTNHILAFLCTMLVETMITKGVSEESFEEMCKRMKDHFKSNHMKKDKS